MATRVRYGSASAQPYGYDLPVGEVEPAAPFGGWMNDSRMDRIRAAQAAGYIVVRSRSVQFPDGRSLQTYQPAGDERDED